jgi:hypothetical protein
MSGPSTVIRFTSEEYSQAALFALVPSPSGKRTWISAAELTRYRRRLKWLERRRSWQDENGAIKENL